MKWSIKIATVFGIPIRVHLSFLLLLLLIAALPGGNGAIAGRYGVILILSVFFCVILHELGHSIVAKGFGLQVESITLLPIGGVASMKTLPSRPIQEFLISSAGPAVSIGLAIVLSWLSEIIYNIDMAKAFQSNSLVQIPMLTRLAIINAWLAMFNLLPAFPMDGGRILRSIIWSFTGFLKATAIAGRIGQVAAVVFFILGLLYNPWLAFIAMFIYIGAKSETEAAYWKEKFSHIPVTEFYNPNIVYLNPEAPILQADEIARQTGQCNIPIVKDNLLEGMLWKNDLVRAVRTGQVNRPVKDFMSKRLTYCTESDNLADVIRTMIDRNVNYVAIVKDGQIKGFITQDGIWDLVSGKGNKVGQ